MSRASDTLAHDLRSALAVVTGFAELLASEREFSLAERREFAERIGAAAEEIRALVAAGDPAVSSTQDADPPA